MTSYERLKIAMLIKGRLVVQAHILSGKKKRSKNIGPAIIGVVSSCNEYSIISGLER